MGSRIYSTARTDLRGGPGNQHSYHNYVNLSRAFAVWHTRRMNLPASTDRYKKHRFPAEISSYGIWLALSTA